MGIRMEIYEKTGTELPDMRTELKQKYRKK
jgi:hypothetical protein